MRHRPLWDLDHLQGLALMPRLPPGGFLPGLPQAFGPLGFLIAVAGEAKVHNGKLPPQDPALATISVPE